MFVSPDDLTTEDRRRVMALCADASERELDAALAALNPVPPLRDLRLPESGTVMVRGRAGGDGAPFNLGEATVTRAAVTLAEPPPASGADGVSTVIGFAYQLGRDAAKARKSAALDALWQMPERRSEVEAALAAVRDRAESERALAARRAAATRVNFFTLVRGED